MGLLDNKFSKFFEDAMKDNATVFGTYLAESFAKGMGINRNDYTD